MDRLKQLWDCYKTINPVFDPAAGTSDSSMTISTTIKPETQHNHITPFTDTKHNNCMSMSNATHHSFSHNHDEGDLIKQTNDNPSSSSTCAFHNNNNYNLLSNTHENAGVVDAATVSSYTHTESCNNINKYIVNSIEVEVIGNIFLLIFLFFFSFFSNNRFREDISSLQTNLQTLSNKLMTNPSITSAPSSLLTQSNLLSSLNLTNINNNNDNQDKLSKIDNLYESIISTTVDNMSSLSHSLTNQISAIKDAYSLPTYTSSNVENSGQDQISLVKEPNTEG